MSSYLGNIPSNNFVSLKRQVITGNGGASYTLDYSVASVNDVAIFVNNVRQDPASYSISTTSLTLGGTISASDSCYIIFLGQALQTVTPDANTITTAMIQDSAITSAKQDVLANPFGKQLLHVEDQKSAAEGGTFTSGAWRTRDLNTIITNEITGASLSSNQITLPSGTYYIDASAPGYRVDRHQLRLRNTTDSSTIFHGSSEFSYNVNLVNNRSLVKGRFTISAQKVFELQHRAETTHATFGFGVCPDSGMGQNGRYAEVQIWRIA